MGICLFRAVLSLVERGGWWSLEDLIRQVAADERTADKTQDALENRLNLTQLWDIFACKPVDPLAVFAAGRVNVLDLGAWEPGPQSLRNLTVRLLADRLFAVRLAAWRGNGTSGIPPVLLCVDEAHDFCPGAANALARPALVRWVKEGRQPGLSLAVATQQPSALTFDLVSQCDLVVIHHLSLQDDIQTTARLAALYAADLPAWLKGVREPGQAVILDDIQERAWVGRVIPEEQHEPN
jgi:DNA helicase HerA-like ATPase